METNNLFNKNQHGFRGGRSCLSQLLSHYERILQFLEEGSNVDVIYLDFSKAFDKLDFNIFLNKLKITGIDGKFFITNRDQHVLVNSSRSAPTRVLSGVSQGSVFGPLLFLILLGDNDISIIHSFLSSFSNDTQIGEGIRSLEDCRKL